MLPFSREAFFAVFASYNAAVWPAQLVLYALAGVLLALAIRGRPTAHRLVPLGLALLWLWTGVAYHWWTTIFTFGLLVCREVVQQLAPAVVAPTAQAKEPAHEELNEKLLAPGRKGVGTPTLAEAALVLTSRVEGDAESLLSGFLQQLEVGPGTFRRAPLAGGRRSLSTLRQGPGSGRPRRRWRAARFRALGVSFGPPERSTARTGSAPAAPA